MEQERCFWCDGVILRHPQTDHLVPRSKCGPDEPWNLVRVCRSCNASKGNNWPVHYATKRLEKNLRYLQDDWWRVAVRRKAQWVRFEPRDDWSDFIAQRIHDAEEAEYRFCDWANETGRVHVMAIAAEMLLQEDERVRRLKEERVALLAQIEVLETTLVGERERYHYHPWCDNCSVRSSTVLPYITRPLRYDPPEQRELCLKCIERQPELSVLSDLVV